MLYRHTPSAFDIGQAWGPSDTRLPPAHRAGPRCAPPSCCRLDGKHFKCHARASSTGLPHPTALALAYLDAGGRTHKFYGGSNAAGAGGVGGRGRADRPSAISLLPPPSFSPLCIRRLSPPPIATSSPPLL